MLNLLHKILKKMNETNKILSNQNKVITQQPPQPPVDNLNTECDFTKKIFLNQNDVNTEQIDIQQQLTLFDTACNFIKTNISKLNDKLFYCSYACESNNHQNDIMIEKKPKFL